MSVFPSSLFEDPHPGNLLKVTDGPHAGKLALLDFGLVSVPLFEDSKAYLPPIPTKLHCSFVQVAEIEEVCDLIENWLAFTYIASPRPS